MKHHKTLVNEALKARPYLKRLKPYVYYPLDWLKERNGTLYRAIQDSKDKSLGEILSLVKEYSKVNYCFYQFDHWPDVDDYLYSESVEADVYGLFTILSDEANNRIREDLARLRTYEEQGDDRLLIDNCLC